MRSISDRRTVSIRDARSSPALLLHPGFARDSSTPVQAADDLEVLVVMSTNGERDLPPAFLRRCITHRIELPEQERSARMREIARRHFGADEIDDTLLGEVIALFGKVRDGAARRKLREPSSSIVRSMFASRRSRSISRRGTPAPQRASAWE